ncbi:ATP-binding protein [Nostoc sp. CENA67]|uniref:ATP-binding protein n=1 Tax=Amazonocrinis nigriterrae CENA67 TaxID=2794033 RepID=A0A8J7HUD5_9NOST|nr:ATP-binding protein [Amazonocrinis nigriterrae]MBH8565917.1 ATP-binding protein [Amazonocrinis nigriterrae CENA67]
MSKTLPIITVLGVISSLTSAFYLGQIGELSFDQVSVQFCPTTANRNQPNARESQGKLDLKYCRYRHRLLKEVWETEQYKAAIPLSEESFFVQEYRGDNSGGVWLLLAPFLAGSAYLAWSNKCQIDYDKKFKQLENLKTYYKLITISARNERDFKATAINQKWDSQRVNAGQISIDAVQDKLRRQREIQERTHTSTLKQFDLNDSQINKQIAEDELAKAKAEQEKNNILNGDTSNTKKTSKNAKSTKLELDSEYQWIYKLLKLPFRVLSGEQGSGKSTLERLMIRLLKDDGWHVVVVNPETNPDIWSGVQVLADVDEINRFFKEFPDAIADRQQQCRDLGIDEDDYLDFIKHKSGLEGKVAVFLAESNTYEVHGVDPDLWANFLKQSLTNIRKWGYTVCLTAHSDNQTSIASKLQGFSKLIDNSPRVDCIAKAGPDGEAISSGKGLLRMKGIGDKEPVEVDLYNYPKSKNFDDGSARAKPPPSIREPAAATTDWNEEIKRWVLKVGGNPAPAQVKAKWESLTGHKLNNDGLNDLMEYLGL